MSGSRYIIGILGLLLLSSISSAYTLVGGILYCDDCADCTNALSNSTYNITYLNKTISGAAADCIDNPNITAKAFDCNGYTISGTGAGGSYGIDIEGKRNASIIGCNVSYFSTGIYIADTSNNITVEDCVTKDNTNIGVWVDSSSNVSILDSLSYNNTNYGFRIRYSRQCYLDNATAYDNNYGFDIYVSGFNTINNSFAYENNFYGVYIRNNATNNTIWNTYAYNNSNSGFVLQDFDSTSNRIYSSTATNNTNDGFYFTDNNWTWIIDTNSNLNGRDGYRLESSRWINITNGSAFDNNGSGYSYNGGFGYIVAYSRAFDNDGYGLHAWGPTTINFLTFTEIYRNDLDGVYLEDGCNFHGLRNDSIYGNLGWGFHALNAHFHVVVNTTIHDNAGGMYLDNSDYSNYTNLILYNNSAANIYLMDSSNCTFNGVESEFSTWGLLIEETSPAGNNRFYDVLIYNTTRPLGVLTTDENNFTNITLGYNESVGLINWNFLNLTNAIINFPITNLRLRSDFISMDDTLLPQLNKSANITITVPYCSPTPAVFRKAGFPSTRADILANGSVYPTTVTCSNNIARFPVTSFSGYAATSIFNQCFYANTPDTMYVLNSSLTGNKSDAICITINASNIMINCTGFSITGNYSAADTWGISVIPSAATTMENITIIGCTVSNYSYGIDLDYDRYVNVSNNVLYNNTYGIHGIANYSVVHNNTLRDNSNFGIRLRGVWTNVTNNIAYNNSNYGIATHVGGGSRGNFRFSDNIAYNNTNGFGLLLLAASTATNNLAYDNTNYGFSILSSTNNSIVNNTAYNNDLDGFAVAVAIDNNFTSITSYNNSEYGFHFYASDNIRLEYMNLYNNGYDMMVNNSGAASASDLTVVNATFRNPSGTLVNYTMLSLSDSISIGEAYSINWTRNSSALPTYYTSFAEKFVNITSQNGTVSIDSVTWHWLDAETGGYDESKFVLAKYSASGWAFLNSTPDIAANRLSYTALNPASDYGILQNNTPQCMVISAPGSYQLSANAVGAPNSAAPFGGTVCIKITASDVDFSCNGFNITNNGTPATTYGVLAVNVDNVTVRNCPSISQYTEGVELAYTNYSIVRNVTSHNNTNYGFSMYLSYYNNLTNNYAYNTTFGFRLSPAYESRLDNNTAYGNTEGFHLQVFSANNTLANNTAYSNTQYGFYLLNALGNRLLDSYAYDNTLYGFLIQSSNFNEFINNRAYNNPTTGFYLLSASNNNVTFNIANFSQQGFYLSSSSNNNLTGNTGRNNTQYGFRISSSNDNAIRGNNAYGNPAVGGFVLSSSSNNTLTDNLAYDHTAGAGFLIQSSSLNNTLINNTGRNNALGITVQSSSHNCTIINGTVRNNANYGFYFSGSYDLSASGLESYTNPNGLGVRDSGLTGSDMHLYNNTVYDMQVSTNGGSGYIVNVTNVTIDNPAGNFQNYTSFVLVDSAPGGAVGYNMIWTAEPATPPSGFFSFEQKYLDISPALDSPSIDLIRFTWLDSELTGYNESKFEVWRRSGVTWSKTSNQTLVVGSNYIEVINLVPTSVYGILQNNLSECMLITGPGSYQLANGVAGAPYPFGNIWGLSRACILINSSDVDFSCNGYGITNNGTANAAGIAVNASFAVAYTNITLRDCPGITGYREGIYMQNSDYNRIQNVTAYSNSDSGFLIVNGQGNNLTNNLAYGPGMAAGFQFTGLGGNLLLNNTVYRATNGFLISSCNNNNLTDNWAYNNSIGYHIEGDSNQLWFNRAETNFQYGFQLRNADTNQLVNNTARGGPDGFFVDGNNLGANGNWLINNTAYSNSNRGFYLYIDFGTGVSNTRLIGNTAYLNQYGYYIDTVTNTNLTDNVARDNTNTGFFFTASTNTVKNLVAYRNPRGLNLGDSGIVGSDLHIYNTTVYGLRVATAGGTGYNINVTNVTIDSPAGSYQNYTSFDINDSAPSGSVGYTMTWTPQPAIPPLTHFSFAQKYTDISVALGAPSMDLIRWTWLDSELPGYDETKFEVWQHNGVVWSNVSSQTRDAAGNYIEVLGFSPSSDYGILQNNNSVPSLTIESPQNITYGAGTIDLNYTVSDVNLESCWYYLDGAGPTALPLCANTTVGPLGDGPHNVTVFVNDTLGEQNSSTVYFTTDATPPAVSIQSPANTTYNISTLDLNYTASDGIGLDSCWYYLDGAGPTPLPGCANTTTGPLADGPHNVTVFANDSANNSASDIVYFLTDATPPSITVESPANTSYNTTNNVDLNFTVGDNIAVNACWYYYDGTGPTLLPACDNITMGGLSNGNHNVTVFVSDIAGNENSSIVFFSVNYTMPTPPGGAKKTPRCEYVNLIPLSRLPCPGDYVYFSVGSGGPIAGARVVIIGTWPWSDVKYTNSSGEVAFRLSANGSYKVYVEGGTTEDYCSIDYFFDYTKCPANVCYEDDDCRDTEYCRLEEYKSDIPVPVTMIGECVPVDCECGDVYDHRCHEYECCADADCTEGYVCENHECVPRGCESDAECLADEYCSDGACLPVEKGQCGYVENHAWFDYECCKDEDCPPGLLCFEHECKLYKIETNETGYVGDRHGVQVYPEGQYDLTMTDPDGRQFTVMTDENGFATFVLEIEGDYGVALFEENESLATVDVRSLKRPLPPEEEKPLVWLEELLKFFWWLLILLLLIIGYLLFRRRKKKRYKAGV